MVKKSHTNVYLNLTARLELSHVMVPLLLSSPVLDSASEDPPSSPVLGSAFEDPPLQPGAAGSQKPKCPLLPVILVKQACYREAEEEYTSRKL